MLTKLVNKQRGFQPAKLIFFYEKNKICFKNKVIQNLTRDSFYRIIVEDA